MIEVELKFRIGTINGIKKILKQKYGCKLTRNIRQEDIVYVREATEDFCIKKGDPVLRLRMEKGQTILTLKKKKEDNAALEIEACVLDKSAICRILDEIGFKRAVSVSKTRQRCNINGLNILIDSVEKLGSFIEIELIVNETDDIPFALEQIRSFAKTIGLSDNDIEPNRYDTLLYALSCK